MESVKRFLFEAGAREGGKEKQGFGKLPKPLLVD